MTEDSINRDGSIEDVSAMLGGDGSAKTEDGTIAADDSSMSSDDSVFTPGFPEGSGGSTGRGGLGPNSDDLPVPAPSGDEPEREFVSPENSDEFSLGYKVVGDKSDSRLPNFLTVTYEQANSWFDEGLGSDASYDIGIGDKIKSAVAHFPGVGSASNSSTDRGIEETDRQGKLTRRAFVHGGLAALAGASAGVASQQTGGSQNGPEARDSGGGASEAAGSTADDIYRLQDGESTIDLDISPRQDYNELTWGIQEDGDLIVMDESDRQIWEYEAEDVEGLDVLKALYQGESKTLPEGAAKQISSGENWEENDQYVEASYSEVKDTLVKNGQKRTAANVLYDFSESRLDDQPVYEDEIEHLLE
ncbi:hypothetical protein [Candidatus Nanohalococcus occultus]|uniref:hypothetical protein n=1 Tax=Candidatus Nanohalococcus occultus TaxID=2978047 RepID=UPI0039E1B000